MPLCATPVLFCGTNTNERGAGKGRQKIRTYPQQCVYQHACANYYPIDIGRKLTPPKVDARPRRMESMACN